MNLAATPSCRDTSNPAADAAMELYAHGDPTAFSVLYDAVVPRLYTYLLRKVRDPARAEDLVQQTMLNVHCARGRFIPGSRVTPWVFAIATRLFLDQVRRKKLEVLAHDVGVPQEHAADGPCPEAFLEGRELEGLLRAEVERLTHPQREVVELVIYAQMSHAEAAEMLGITVASVKLRLQRASRAVKDALRASELAEVTA